MVDVEKLRFRPDVLFKDLGDEGVLLNPLNSAYFRLNELGLRVFRVLAEEKPKQARQKLEALGNEIAQEFAVPLERVQSDIDNFITALVRRQLFE